eukprot:354266-Chlamydomonas_euryale.AAC.26
MPGPASTHGGCQVGLQSKMRKNAPNLVRHAGSCAHASGPGCWGAGSHRDIHKLSCQCVQCVQRKQRVCSVCAA